MDKQALQLKIFKDSKEAGTQYICRALSGMKLDDPNWQIKRFASTEEGDFLLYAGGTEDFCFKASDREKLEYK